MRALWELLAERFALLSAIASASITLLILLFMAYMGLPAIKNAGFFQLLLSPWYPYAGMYGVLPMIVTTIRLSLLCLAFAIPLSLGCSFLITTIAPRTVAKSLRRMIELMTGIPTVIYGFVGIFLLVPLLREMLESGSGMCILAAAMMLAVMISPTMTLFFCDSFDRIPRSYLNAADALGASPIQKLFYVTLPSARAGMLNGVVLGLGRAVGDTLIALMLAGNSIDMPESMLDSARTLTAHIALVFAADYESPEFSSIFTCGLVLYVFTTMTTLFVRYYGRGEAGRA